MLKISSLFIKLLLCSFTVIIASLPAKSQSDTIASIQFQKTSYNFKRHLKGSIMEHTFKFSNTGKTNLQLRNVVTTCGCTVPEWPSEPIAPGQSGTIEVTYDSQKVGKFKRYLTVHSNAGVTKLLIRGNVLEKR